MYEKVVYGQRVFKLKYSDLMNKVFLNEIDLNLT